MTGCEAAYVPRSLRPLSPTLTPTHTHTRGKGEWRAEGKGAALHANAPPLFSSLACAEDLQVRKVLEVGVMRALRLPRPPLPAHQKGEGRRGRRQPCSAAQRGMPASGLQRC